MQQLQWCNGMNVIGGLISRVLWKQNNKAFKVSNNQYIFQCSCFYVRCLLEDVHDILYRNSTQYTLQTIGDKKLFCF